jgi:hypothetical protein
VIALGSSAALAKGSGQPPKALIVLVAMCYGPELAGNASLPDRQAIVEKVDDRVRESQPICQLG